MEFRFFRQIIYVLLRSTRRDADIVIILYLLKTAFIKIEHKFLFLGERNLLKSREIPSNVWSDGNLSVGGERASKKILTNKAQGCGKNYPVEAIMFVEHRNRTM